MERKAMFYSAGIDVGCSSVKTVLVSADRELTAVDFDIEKIRKRNIKDVIRESFDRVLKQNNLKREDVSYVASTGEGEMVDFRRGHFYSMTCHARGGIYLQPQVRAVVDVGALHAKAIQVDERSKVLGYRMTSQCASGSGQFLENIARYLGVPNEDIGSLSMKADHPETPSGICAVLAETDVINMVSRKISTPNILKGIHLSMARRLLNLIRMLKVENQVLVTGGLAHDQGLMAALQELADKDNTGLKILNDEKSVFAGAIGAALWGAFRHERLQQSSENESWDRVDAL